MTTNAMDEPIVSVILTSYNQAERLEQAIESVLGQTLAEWELVLIDNGSTDGSGEIIERYAAHPRIIIIRHEKNQPHTVILNEGIRRARGRYISLLFSDDYYLPEKLRLQVEAFAALSEEFGIVYSAGYRLKQEGRLELAPAGPYEGAVLKALLTRPAFFLPIAPLVLRRALLEFPFDESIFMEGEGIYLKLAIHYSFHSMPEPLVVCGSMRRTWGRESSRTCAGAPSCTNASSRVRTSRRSCGTFAGPRSRGPTG